MIVVGIDTKIGTAISKISMMTLFRFFIRFNHPALFCSFFLTYSDPNGILCLNENKL